MRMNIHNMNQIIFIIRQYRFYRNCTYLLFRDFYNVILTFCIPIYIYKCLTYVFSVSKVFEKRNYLCKHFIRKKR